jgi:hypothetical protein
VSAVPCASLADRPARDLTIRQHFAAQMLAAIVGDYPTDVMFGTIEEDADDAANLAVMLADALVARLTRESSGKGE